MANAADHPVPQRIFHWINLISMAMLIITGLYIHKPFASGWMHVARGVHFFFMYLITFNLIARVYYAFLGKHPDYRDFSFGKKDITNFVGIVKYYLFIGPHVHGGKYNALQKLSYIAIVPLILLQALTGFAIYFPHTFGGVLSAFGGLAAARAIHYLFMWIFIAFTIVHFYMAASETWDQVLLMLFNIEKREDRVIDSGEDYDLGGREHPAAR